MSTTGQIAGGIIGAAAAFFFAPAGYVMLGAQLGILAGGLADPPKGPTTVGPRLSDLTIQTSTYGAVIPRVYGTDAFSGNVFWLEGNKIKETMVKKKSGGKGGGGKSTSKTWVNTATFAVGLCQGPIAGIRRIWIKGELFYDAGSSDPSTIAASNLAAEGFQVYLGTDTQAPDPRIQADVGAARCPAWRGLAYIVFYDLPLAKYGDALMGAQVKVEVVKDGNTGTFVPTYGLFTNARSWSYQSVTSWGNSVFLSLAGGRAICATSPDGITWTEHSSLPVSASWFGNCYGEAAGLFVVADGNSRSSVYTSPDGITWTARSLGVSRTIRSINWNGSLFLATTYWEDFLTSPDGITWTPRSHPRTNNFAHAAWNGSLWVATCATLGVVVWSTDAITWTEQAMPGTGFDIIAANGSTFCASRASDRHVAISTNGTSWTEYATGVATAFDSITSGGGVFLASGLDNAFWTSVDGITWTERALSASEPWQGACFDGVGFSIVDSSYGQCCYIRANVLAITNPTLSSIVSEECIRSGLLSAGDIDVADLTSTVRGYLVASTGTIRSALEPLQAAWPFDVVQRGYKIKFLPRGGSSVVTIDADDLDARSASGKPGVQITTSREMDSQLPRVLTIKHVDYDREYEAGEQYVERLNTDAINDVKMELPIVLTAGEAVGKAETLLYLRWLERFDVSFSIPGTYNQLEPGDVVTLETPEGNISLRLVAINYTSDGRLECRAKYNNAAIYTPAAVGEPSAVTSTPTISVQGGSRYVLMDIPTVHTDQTYAVGFVAAMCGAFSSGWAGGNLMTSTDSGTTWSIAASFAAPGATIGYATNSIGDVDERTIDCASLLQVELYNGELFSITEAAMLSGGNYFAYGADGRWEIIAAQNCVLQVDGSYWLTNLLRGRNGTEWTMGLHSVGDTLVLLDPDDIQLITLSPSAISQTRLYRAITEGRDISTDSDRSFAYQGVNLKPLSPLGGNMTRNTSTDDLTLYAYRRSRIIDEWRDYVDIDIGESAESYEWDVCTDNTYATVVRTLSATGTNSIIYTAAEQTADFGDVQTTLSFVIYQMSSTVGRGYPSYRTYIR